MFPKKKNWHIKINYKLGKISYKFMKKLLLSNEFNL
jgi:hypothetical protein